MLVKEVLEHLNATADGVYLDGTLGGGGHSEAILASQSGNLKVYGIDRDPEAIQAAGERLKHFHGFQAIHGNFHHAKQVLASVGVLHLDGALLDLGVSSHQIDTPMRGFSYHQSAPLDMRMDPSQGITAAQFLASADMKTLTRVLWDYGEEKWAARIARIIVERREHSPLLTTADLTDAVDAAIPRAVRRKSDGHPARHTFQAIRIAINDELGPLADALNDILSLIVSGGRLVVITFHSLEDRIVKRTFAKMQNPCVCSPKSPVCVCGGIPVAKMMAGGAVKPSMEEVWSNPRARSAKLRVVRRL